MSQILAVGTGGTIQNTTDGYLELGTLLDRLRSEYPNAYAEGVGGARLEVADFTPAASSDVTEAFLIELAKFIRAAADETPDLAFVVTVGTVAAEELAYLLHLNLPVAGPIVLAASLVRHGAPGNDGDANLLGALRVARSPEMVGAGCVLVMDGQIHSARDFRKGGHDVGGFSSRPFGPLGRVDPDGVWLYRRPTRRHTVTSLLNQPLETLPVVEVVPSFVGAGATAIRAAVAAGVAGIVVEGFAANGRAAVGQRDALAEARSIGVPVVATSRTPEGGRVRPPAEDRMVSGDNLTASRARIALQLALAAGFGPTEIIRVFEEH